ncbi:MAG TPA: nickel-dependent hydrogenase large subunit, partial [Polyangiaceae bacterium]|nr:nickel-dependent hydrogenase large subunit [Polyangiaceae bacterium]
MGRTIEINPVTRIEGHAKVSLELDDAGKVAAATLHVLEFRGFERFVEGMQVELMPTLTTRICRTCPHAHHLAAAKAVDRVFGVTPPRAAVLLRELINCGSMIHSHAIHFFALAGPDLLLGIGAPPEQRSVVALLDLAPDVARQALELRSLGQRMVEIVGGRGTHPVTCVAGGMSAGIDREAREKLQRMAARALELARVALEVGKGALARDPDLLRALPLAVADLGTV